MTLTRYGIREWGLATAAAVAVVAWSWPAPWITAATVLAWIVVAGFFRDPLLRRPATADAQDLVSPADGVVSAVLDVPDHECVDGAAVIVRIFLSVLDVHVNRMPCEVEVMGMRHIPGKYLDARTEESARVNESNLLHLRAPSGARLGVRQVSGAIARRIVCPLRVGDRFARGQRFGMIKFGSTTELIVPRAAVSGVLVRKGDRVKGGVTILVRLDAPAAVR